MTDDRRAMEVALDRPEVHHAGDGQLRVLDDPASGAQLAILRDRTTGADAFRTAARRLGAMLAVEAVRDLPTRIEEVETPLGSAAVRRPAVRVVVVPVLRAGLGLLPGVQDVLPMAAVGMIGLKRDEQTHEPSEYYANVPIPEGAWLLVLEPMLATGGSASAALTRLPPAQRTRLLSVVATQPALDRLAAEHPDLDIVAAAVDPGLDERAFIVPGLGDFGDRLFGT